VGNDFIWVGRRISHDWFMFLVNFRGDEKMIAIKMHKRRVATGMSVVGEVLLDVINRNSKIGISVMTLISRTVEGGLGSQATNHRALNWLKENKYIKVTFKDGDNRTKYLVPTKKGLSHFKGLE